MGTLQEVADPPGVDPPRIATGCDSYLRDLTNGDDLVVITDDDDLLVWLSGEGVPSIPWSPDLVVDDGTNVVLAVCHLVPNKAVRKQFSRASVLIVPISAFDDSPDSIRYTMDQVFRTNFVENVRRNEVWIELLRNKPDGCLHFVGPGTDLRCRINDDIKVFTTVELSISQGEWVSVADFCEVQLTAPATGDWCGAFTVDGHAQAVGVLVATDARVTPEGLDRVRAAKQLREELVADGPVHLEMRQSALCSAMAGGRDRAQEISAATNPEYGLHMVELGLGSNAGIADGVDWRINSQLNEGIGTFHLGFGEGMTGAHMDFVIEHATVL